MADEMEGVVTEQEALSQPTDVSAGSSSLSSICNTKANVSAIKSNFALLEKAVAQFDSRFTLRALRSISFLRKKLSGPVLSSVVASTYPANTDNETPHVLFRAIGLDEPGSFRAKEEWKKGPATKDPIPEIDIFLAILIQVLYSYGVGSR